MYFVYTHTHTRTHAHIHTQTHERAISSFLSLLWYWTLSEGHLVVVRNFCYMLGRNKRHGCLSMEKCSLLVEQIPEFWEK